MGELFNLLNTLSESRSIWIYLFIFFGKLLEVSTSTLRMVLINRGIRAVGSMIAVVEISMWVVLAGTVLSSIHSDPIRIPVYAVAYGLGNYVGSWLDEKLAFGLSSIQVVVPDEMIAKLLGEALRAKEFGVTTMNVQGMSDKSHFMLLLMIKRKHLREALELITSITEKAVITVSDVKVQKGGYMRGISAKTTKAQSK